MQIIIVFAPLPVECRRHMVHGYHIIGGVMLLIGIIGVNALKKR